VGTREFLAAVISFRSQLWIAAAILFGVLAGTVCNFATQLKFLIHCDDALDVGITSSTRYMRIYIPSTDLCLSCYWWFSRQHSDCTLRASQRRRK
jgi:uncharacterized integral membrane protein